MNGANIKFTIGYLLAIVIVNFAFTYLPMLELPFDQAVPYGTFLVGFIFVLRDLAQREIGHKVLAVMAVGVILSYLLADPFVAVASAVAFAISEIIDWAVYTITKKPLRERILLSSCASTPVDSFVFMSMLGFFSWMGLIVMVIVKMIGALAVWKMMR